MIFLVVFTVTNIIHFPVSLLVIRCKSQVCIKMVHALTVTLVCKPPWYFIMWSANQIIYHSLKYNIEAFCKYVFLSMRIDGDTIRVLEECIAQIPKLQSLVWEIFIFDLHESHLTHAFQVFLEQFAGNQFILNIDGSLEAILFVQIVQDTIVNDEQLLLKVHNALLIYKLQIYGSPILLNKCIGMTDCFCPVYLINSAMHVLDGKEHKIAVFLIESDERKYNIEISIRVLPFAFSWSRDMLIENGFTIRISFIEYAQSSVNPNRKFIDKLTIFSAQFLLVIRR